MCKSKNEEHISMATSTIPNTSINNALRNSDQDLLCKIVISIDITKKLKNTRKRFHF